MNSFIKQVVRKGTVGLQIFSQQYHSSSAAVILKSTTSRLLPINSENYITQLVQRNIIPVTDKLPRASIVDRPCTNITAKIDTSILRKTDIKPRKIVYDPYISVEKLAHKMLIIKRKKMNRHKHEKRHRKLRFVYMSIRRIRYAKSENQFKAEIAMKLKELEKFDPVEYVNSRLEKYRQVVLPNRIPGGCRMPPFVVEEVLAKKQKLREERLARQKRKQIFMAENGGTLDVKS